MTSHKPKIAVKIALAVFAVFCLVSIFRLKIELDELVREHDQLVADVESSEAYVRRLENKLSSDFDEKYVEGVAKEKLKLVLPEEVIFYNDIAG